MSDSKNLNASDTLFSDMGPLDPEKGVVLFELAGQLARLGMDKELIFNGVKYALNNESKQLNDAHKVLAYFKKWSENEKPSVREFLEEELREILESLYTVKISLSEIESESLSKATKEKLRKNIEGFKSELEKRFKSRFGGDYSKLTKALGITDEYSVKRFFREKRIPKHETLKDYFKALDIKEVKFRIV